MATSKAAQTRPSVAPATRAARLARVVDLLQRVPVHSQTQLAELLAADGVAVTQATLSRDLEEIGAVKVRDEVGALVYAVPDENGSSRRPKSAPDSAPARLARLCEDLLVAAEASENLVVAKTPPGGAQLLASALDRAAWPAILGTVAGDDTVLVICRTSHGARSGGAAVARRLLGLAEGRSVNEGNSQ